MNIGLSREEWDIIASNAELSLLHRRGNLSNSRGDIAGDRVVVDKLIAALESQREAKTISEVVQEERTECLKIVQRIYDANGDECSPYFFYALDMVKDAIEDRNVNGN